MSRCNSVRILNNEFKSKLEHTVHQKLRNSVLWHIEQIHSYNKRFYDLSKSRDGRGRGGADTLRHQKL